MCAHEIRNSDENSTKICCPAIYMKCAAHNNPITRFNSISIQNYAFVPAHARPTVAPAANAAAAARAAAFVGFGFLVCFLFSI